MDIYTTCVSILHRNRLSPWLIFHDICLIYACRAANGLWQLLFVFQRCQTHVGVSLVLQWLNDLLEQQCSSTEFGLQQKRSLFNAYWLQKDFYLYWVMQVLATGRAFFLLMAITVTSFSSSKALDIHMLLLNLDLATRSVKLYQK